MKVALRETIVVGLIGVGLVALGPGGLGAQERIRLAGWVQWVGGTRMQVMTEGGTVAVDLREAAQGSYQGLRPGERVVVDGVVASDRSRVMARDIWRHADRGDVGIQAP